MQVHKLPKLEFSQEESIQIFLDCMSEFAGNSSHLLPASERKQLSELLGVIRSEKPQMFKDFDESIAQFFRKNLMTVAENLKTDRMKAMIALEDHFQALRALPSYNKVHESILPESFVEDRAETGVLLAGCGKCPEAVWLLSRFQRCRLHFCDINEKDIQVLESQLSSSHASTLERCIFSITDLTRTESLANSKFSAFIFYHPLLLDFQHYAQLMQGLQSEKSPERKRNLTSSASMSVSATKIFDNILSHLPSGGKGLVTVVDELEAQALEKYLISRKLTFKVLRNPYALRKLAVLISEGSTARELEQRTYHFVFQIEKSETRKA